MMNAEEALERLRDGNRRFASGTWSRDEHLRHSLQVEMAKDREPFAIILGCSDARVPVELVFDQGLGDLFVIRIAGNIVAPSQVGSAEFAAARFGTRLIVVLGHSRCGAVLATLEDLRQPAGIGAEVEKQKQCHGNENQQQAVSHGVRGRSCQYI